MLRLNPGIMASLLIVATGQIAAAVDYTAFPHWVESFGDAEGRDITSVTIVEILGQPYVLATAPSHGLMSFRPGPDGLELLSDLAVAGAEVGVAVAAWDAYVAGDGPSARLSKVNVAFPENPMLVWQSSLPLQPRGVALLDHYALLPCGGDGLLVFDLTEVLGIPVGVVGQWDSPALEVSVIDGHVFVLTSSGLSTLDLTDPTAPGELAHLDLDGATTMVAHAGSLVIGRSGNVAVVDISDPLDPQAVAFANVGFPPVALASAGDDIWVAGHQFVEVLGPELVVQWRTPLDIGTAGNTCLAAGLGLTVVGTERRGLQVLVDGIHESVQPVTSFHIDGFNPQVRQLVGDILYVTVGGESRAYRADENSSEPVWVHAAPDPGAIALDLLVADGRAFVAYTSGVVEVLDVTGPQAEPIASVLLSEDHEIFDLAWTGSALAVLWNHVDAPETAVSIFALTGSQLEQLGFVAVDTNQRKLGALGNVLALWNTFSIGTSVTLIDISDPTQPQPAGDFPKPGLSDVVTSGAYLYVLGGETLQALHFVAPFYVEAGPELQVPSYNGYHILAPAGELGFLSFAELMFDLDDPLVPRPIGSFANLTVDRAIPVFSNAGRVVLYKFGYVYSFPPQAADLTAAPDAAPAVVPAPITLLQAAPNPFNPQVTLVFRMPHAGDAQLEILDVRGRRVVAQSVTVHESGETSVVWDGRSDEGRALPSGTYLARVTGPGVTAITKVTLAR